MFYLSGYYGYSDSNLNFTNMARFCGFRFENPPTRSGKSSNLCFCNSGKLHIIRISPIDLTTIFLQ